MKKEGKIKNKLKKENVRTKTFGNEQKIIYIKVF